MHVIIHGLKCQWIYAIELQIKYYKLFYQKKKVGAYMRKLNCIIIYLVNALQSVSYIISPLNATSQIANIKPNQL